MNYRDENRRRRLRLAEAAADSPSKRRSVQFGSYRHRIVGRDEAEVEELRGLIHKLHNAKRIDCLEVGS